MAERMDSGCEAEIDDMSSSESTTEVEVEGSEKKSSRLTPAQLATLKCVL